MKATATKPDSPTSIPCFECEAGELCTTIEDHATHHPKLGEVVIPDVPILRCDQCGDVVIGQEGNARIDAWLDAALGTISPEEIRALLTKYNLTQRRASQITGLGEKNICRWLTGRSRPSESVSNFLRLLLADEDAFERLKQKNFTEHETPGYPAEERQPNAEEKTILKCVDFPKLVEIGIVDQKLSPKERRSQLCQLTKSSDLLEFEQIMERSFDKMAAFKDTGQKWNAVSGGLWVWLGEQAARKKETAPYSRDKLRFAVGELRELTVHPLAQVAAEVTSILARAGVALVFVPAMKESALRGCTRLLTPNKGLIIHSLKYRSLSQFWIILFHEIAHLLLHISKSGETFADYEEKSEDPRENDADNWAYDTLVSLDRELEFKSNTPTPEPRQVAQFAEKIGVHPAIVAEVFNRRADEDVISYAYMRKERLFPQLSEIETKALMMTSMIVDP
jgi:putative zinc finger/helix-turn-helix YgiT family protein